MSVTNMLTVLTANDLRTGKIVYWSKNGHWGHHIEQAFIATNETEQAQLDAVLTRSEIEVEVVGAYLVQGTSDCGISSAISHKFPKKLRERRRIYGPSVGAAV